MNPTPDPIIRVLRLLTLLVGAMVMLAVYVVLCAPRFDAPDAKDVTACDPAVPDELQCEPGAWCVHAVCTPREALCQAQRGEQCHDCDCAVGLRCGEDLRCHLEDETATAPTCADPAVRDAIDRLTRDCRARKRSVQEQAEGDMGCSADEWRQLLANNAEIGDLLAAFPERFAVYFPVNEPRRSGWTGARRAEMSRQFEAHAESLRRASAILIIGRATPDGLPDEDTQLAVRRLNTVERLLDQALYAGKKPSERVGGPMLASWGARGERSIPLDTFIRNFAGTHAPITMHAEVSARLTASIARARRNELGQAERDALEKTLNRVTVVIPIHCPLTGAGGR